MPVLNLWLPSFLPPMRARVFLSRPPQIQEVAPLPDGERFIEASRQTVPRRSRVSFPAKRRRTYRGTSLIAKRTPLGPYRRPMHRVLGGS